AVVAPASGIVDVRVSIEGFGYQVATAVPASTVDTFIGTVDTTQLDDGDAWLGAIITDAAGNQRFVYDRKVTIDNGPGEVAPQVSITSPTDGASVDGTVVVSGHVLDDQGDLPTDAAATLSVDDVVVDSQLLFGDGAFSFAVDTSTLANGPHTFQVSATDVVGNVGQDAVTVTVANPVAHPVTESFAAELKGRTKVGVHTFDTEAGPATITVATPPTPGKKVDTWTVTLRGPGGTVVAAASGTSGDVVTIATTITAGTHTIEVEGKGAYSGQVTHLQY
ncbi:MAG TPA: Ig-like domain-containing protein, partial [Nitriliruptoraceae bacterium]|nr:Ig-like domain-containing protein [Nitriliruptoraceae bacterium]